MAPLIVLIVTFFVLFAGNRFLLSGRFSPSLLGRMAMSTMLIVTGITHFTSSGVEIMLQMMPDIVPIKREMVYFTGVCELAAAIGLLWNKTSRLASILLIVFFIAILPANIAGSLKQVNFSGMEYGAVYLAFRVPLQMLFIGWTWYFGCASIPRRRRCRNDL